VKLYLQLDLRNLDIKGFKKDIKNLYYSYSSIFECINQLYKKLYTLDE